MKKLSILFFLLGSFYLVQAQETKDSTLQDFTGKYKFPEGSIVTEVTVALENGGLTMTSAVGTSPLQKIGDDLFSITQFEGTAQFKRDANKKVTGVSINAQGYALEGTKSESPVPGLVRVPLLAKRNYDLMR